MFCCLGLGMNRDAAVFKRLINIQKDQAAKHVKNIDCIYLINLDKRKDRLQRCMSQLTAFDIQPQRVPAVDGWALSQDVFNDIAMKYQRSMKYDLPVHFSPVSGYPRGFRLNDSCHGKACVYHTMMAGALGCYLSHLSVLFDAYYSSYRTIWVLEDDITVNDNPHLLSELIEKLDRYVPDNWDILYTDNDDHFDAKTLMAHMDGGIWGRPDVPVTRNLIEFSPIGSDFYKIGGRTQTHSMIIRRSGFEKILEYISTNGIFRSYDVELAFIPNIKLYNLSHDVVHGRDRSLSDTSYQHP